MPDQILRAMTTDGWVKAVAMTSREIVERARTIHNTTATATAAVLPKRQYAFSGRRLLS